MEAEPAQIPAPPEPAAKPPVQVQPPGRRKRRWPRRVAYVLVVLALIVTFAPFALSIAPVRRYVAERISVAVGRRVTIGGITARWWSGIDLRNVEVHNPEGFPGEPLLSIDSIHMDVQFLSLATGRVKAEMTLLRPVVNLLKSATGERNTDGLGEPEGKAKKVEATPAEPKPPPPPAEKVEPSPSGRRPGPEVVVRVEGGRVVSQNIGGPDPGLPDVIDAVEASFHLESDGRTWGRFAAVAKGAGAGGQDAAISASAELDGSGAGPVRLNVPPLNLSRLQKLAGASLNLDAISGTASATADLVLDAKGRPSGTAHAEIDNVTTRRGEGTVAWKRAVVDVRAEVKGDAAPMRFDATIDALKASGFAAKGEALDEPHMTISGVVSRGTGGDVTFGEANAPIRVEGRILSGTLLGSVKGRGSDSTADVSGDFTVALSPTLGRWLGILSKPEEDLRGTLRVRAKATGRGGLIDESLDATIEGLVLGGAAGRKPLREPKVALLATGRLDEGAHTMTTSSATLTADSITARATEPVVVTGLEAGGRLSFTGAFTADADLGRLGDGLRAFAPALDDFESGRVHAEARTVRDGGAAPGTRLAWTVTGNEIQAAPGRFSFAPYVERQVEASGRFDKPEGGVAVLTIASWKSAPVSLVEGKGTIAMRFSEPEATLDGSATAIVNLAALSRAFDLAIGLKRGESLAGSVTLVVAAKSSGDAWSADATIEGKDVRIPPSWGDTGAPERIDGRVVAKSGGAKGAVVLETASLKGFGLDVRARGSEKKVGSDYDLDLSGSIDGDMKTLAAQLKALLGESYEDLSGDGRLAGTFVLTGPTASGGKDLRVDASVTFGRVESGGFTLENGRASMKRPQPGTPLLLSAESTANKGTMRFDGSCDLGRDKSPWRGQADLTNVDTSSLVVGKGAGRFLPMILPAIVPAGQASPVLSGQMTAHLELGSTSIYETDLTNMLKGPGRFELVQGTVQNSTLFSALAGGGSGGASKGFTTLLGMVPSVGKTFRDLGRALVFTNLLSRFEIGNRQIRLLEVKMDSQSVSLKFDGTVGFDGSLALKVPVKLEGDVGRAVQQVVPDRTIPMKVSGKVRDLKAYPDLDLKDVAAGGLLDQLKKKFK